MCGSQGGAGHRRKRHSKLLVKVVPEDKVSWATGRWGRASGRWLQGWVGQPLAVLLNSMWGGYEELIKHLSFLSPLPTFCSSPWIPQWHLHEWGQETWSCRPAHPLCKCRDFAFLLLLTWTGPGVLKSSDWSYFILSAFSSPVWTVKSGMWYFFVVVVLIKGSGRMV